MPSRGRNSHAVDAIPPGALHQRRPSHYAFWAETRATSFAASGNAREWLRTSSTPRVPDTGRRIEAVQGAPSSRLKLQHSS
jgi:hypothetical protein